jgi:hypothetical protein
MEDFFGVRWQAQRDTALDCLEFRLWAAIQTKAPSPLRSAGAPQIANVVN